MHIRLATYKTFTIGQARHHTSIGPKSEARETQPAAFISEAAAAPRGVSTRLECCSCLQHADRNHHQQPPKMKEVAGAPRPLQIPATTAERPTPRRLEEPRSGCSHHQQLRPPPSRTTRATARDPHLAARTGLSLLEQGPPPPQPEPATCTGGP
jgi:hypothetical protein